MTLHQAAQKAVEAVPRFRWDQDMDVLAGPYPDGEWVRRADVIAALQQQPEPEAPIGWLYDWTHSSALGKPDEQFTGFTTDEAHARKHDSPRAVYAAPPALQHQEVPSTAVIPPAPPECETEDEKTAFSFGYWQGLHAARKGQEVPREPVAVARPLTSEEEENAWNSITEQGCSCCTAAVRLFCRLNGITLSDAVLAASPSTTRQQEVGSRPYRTSAGDTLRGIAHRELGDAERWPEIKRLNMHAFDPESEGWSRPRAGTLLALPAAPSTPENADGGPHG